MNRKEQLKRAESLTNCYKCNKVIDKNNIHFVEDFYNSTINEMDVRLECFPRHKEDDE